MVACCHCGATTYCDVSQVFFIMTAVTGHHNKFIQRFSCICFTDVMKFCEYNDCILPASSACAIHMSCLDLLTNTSTTSWLLSISPCRKSLGKMQYLRENCAENALKLRTIYAICTQIELKNCKKKFALKCFVVVTKSFFTVLFQKYSTVTVIQPSSSQ